MVQFEEVDIMFLRNQKWTIDELVTWLLSSHIHIITCHPHMGTETLEWPVVELYTKLKKLTYHVGFPAKEELSCPVWSQDKFGYLEALPSTFVLPTYTIPLSREMTIEEIEDNVKR